MGGVALRWTKRLGEEPQARPRLEDESAFQRLLTSHGRAADAGST